MSAEIKAKLPVETAIADAAGLAALVRETTSEGGAPATRRGQWAWALYEAARDPNVYFQIYIISPFFAGVMMRDHVRGQELWGNIATYSGFVTAVVAPFFGAIADKGGARKPWLALFTALMVASFAGTVVGVPNSTAMQIFIVGLAVVINNIVFELSNAFHGAMLPAIAPASRMGSLSGLAYGLGSAAGFALLAIFLFGFMAPDQPLFSLDKASHEPERWSGPISAVWMLVLALPLFLFTPDKPAGLPIGTAVREGIGAVLNTVRSLRHYRNVAYYIGARTLFNDGMTGVLTFAGIYAAGTFGFDAKEMSIYGLTMAVFAALGGFLGGWLDDRLGSKRALLVSIGGTALAFGVGLTMAPDRILWVFHVEPRPIAFPIFDTVPKLVYLATSCFSALCIVAGYANSRTMMARIAPVEKMTEFFGLLSLSGTAATFLAPVSVSWMTAWTGSQRGGLIPVVALLALGWIWMFWVREERAGAA
jgi:UMF1 family MFS transporter